MKKIAMSATARANKRKGSLLAFSEWFPVEEVMTQLRSTVFYGWVWQQ